MTGTASRRLVVVDRDAHQLASRRAPAARPGWRCHRRRRCRCSSSTGRRPGARSRPGRRRRARCAVGRRRMERLIAAMVDRAASPRHAACMERDRGGARSDRRELRSARVDRRRRAGRGVAGRRPVRGERRGGIGLSACRCAFLAATARRPRAGRRHPRLAPRERSSARRCSWRPATGTRACRSSTGPAACDGRPSVDDPGRRLHDRRRQGGRAVARSRKRWRGRSTTSRARAREPPAPRPASCRASTSAAFIPPNPNEVETAASTRAGGGRAEDGEIDRRVEVRPGCTSPAAPALDGHGRDRGLDRARRAERVPVQALRARDRDAVGERAEGERIGARLGRLVERRAGRVRVDVADALRARCRRRPVPR